MHNAIKAGLSISNINDLIEKVHNTNTWFKRSVDRSEALKTSFDLL